MKMTLFLMFGFCVAARASEPVGTVLQKVSNSSKLVIQRSGAVLREGELVIIDFSEDACEARVIGMDAQTATLSLAGCAHFSEIKKGQLVTASVHPARDDAKSAEQRNRWYFAPAVSVGPVSAAEFSAVRVRDNLTSGGTETDVNGHADAFPAISAQMAYMGQNQWGFLGGFTYNFQHDIDGISVNTNGLNYTLGGRQATFQSLVVDASALYKWRYFYLPFGLNFSFPSLRGLDSRVTGGVGIQVGAGFVITDYFGLEVWVRSERLRARSFQAQNYTVNYQTGTISSLLFSARFFLPL